MQIMGDLDNEHDMIITVRTCLACAPAMFADLVMHNGTVDEEAMGCRAYFDYDDNVEVECPHTHADPKWQLLGFRDCRQASERTRLTPDE